MRLRKSAGFSLIELLIVVAIIAALVGVAVPMFQQNLLEAHRAKAQADLETIRKAILQHDAHERPLMGISMDSLVGRYIQEIPRDPWGNAYSVDLGVGVLVCFGGDNKAGGEGEDEDLVLHFRSELKLQKVTYNGGWGLPKIGNRLRLYWSKSFIVTGNDPIPDLVMILDGKAATSIPLGGGAPFVDRSGPTTATVPASLASMAWGGTVWTYNPAKSDPDIGLMQIDCTAEPDPQTAGSNTIRLTAANGINVKQSVVAAGSTTSTSIIHEHFAKGGPLDTAAFGDQALAPHSALPAEPVGDENRGVLLQRETQ